MTPPPTESAHGPHSDNGVPVVDPLVIVGPTAVGKSAVAMAVASACGDAEIVSADSMQVYRGMDIGTAKPDAAAQAAVPHHVIDLVDPHEDFALPMFQAAAQTALGEIAARGNRAIIVGGTGLYVRSLVDSLEIPGSYPAVAERLEADPDTEALFRQLAELDPIGAARMEPSNRRRIVRALEVTVGSGRPFSSFGPGLERYPPVPFVQLGLDRDRSELDERIAARYTHQLEAGFVEEVRALWARPQGVSPTAAQALGYKEIADHLAGAMSLEAAVELANKRTRRFARRQQRWFRRDPRIEWISLDNRKVPSVVEQVLRQWLQ